MSTPTPTDCGAVVESGASRPLTAPALPPSRDRRDRILDAAVTAAATGGYEAVQMRAVAEHAGVAVGTLYRYYPSKAHLLVSALAREFERMDTHADLAGVRADSPYQRLHQTLSRLNNAIERKPRLAEAMARAFVLADASAAAEVDHIAELADGMFARAIAGDQPGHDHHQIARVISEVWLSNLLAWLTQRTSAAQVSQRLDIAARLLIGDAAHPKI